MKVKLEELSQAKDGILYFDFEDLPVGIDLAEPAKAKLTVKKSGGGYINITGVIEGKLNATCDNCLKNFILPLKAEIDELFIESALFSEYKEETEIKDNLFVTDLNGAEEIDLTDLMYQSLILTIPNKLVCDINCMGDEEIRKYIKKDIQDPRLEIFKTIKTEKDN